MRNILLLLLISATAFGQSLNIRKDTLRIKKEMYIRDTTLRNYVIGLSAIGAANVAKWADSSKIYLGSLAGSNNTASIFIAIGEEAGKNNIGTNQLSIGFGAGQENKGSRQIAIGNDAGYGNEGALNISIGAETSNVNTGDSTIFIGFNRGLINSVDGRIEIDPTSTTKPLIDGYAIGDSLVINGLLTTKNPHAFLYFDNKMDVDTLTTQNTWYKVAQTPVGIFEFYDHTFIDSVGRDTINIVKRGTYMITYHLTLSINDTKQNVELRIFNVTKNAPIPATVGNRSPTTSGDTFSLGNTAYCHDCAANDKIILQIRNIDASGKFVTYKYGSIAIQFIHQ